MAAWRIIVPDDLNRIVVGAQMSALRKAALAPGQADPAVETIQIKADYVRARIGGRVRVSATPLSVPPELVEQVSLLVLEALAGRLPGIDLTPDQVTRISRVYKDLDIAGTDEFPLSAADNPAVMVTDGSNANIKIVQPGRDANSRNKMSGL